MDKYQTDDSVPLDVLWRQRIADQNHSPQRNIPCAAKDLTAGDFHRRQYAKFPELYSTPLEGAGNAGYNPVQPSSPTA